MSKRLAWIVLATSVLLLFATSSASATNTIACKGKTTLASKRAFTHQVDYEITCNEPVTGFAIATNRLVDTFGPETIVLDKRTRGPVNGEAFSCEGPIPSFGFACVGKADKFVLPRIVKGTFVTADPVCSKKAGGLRTLLYVTDADKRIAGVWKLKPPTCPKPKKKRSTKS